MNSQLSLKDRGGIRALVMREVLTLVGIWYTSDLGAIEASNLLFDVSTTPKPVPSVVLSVQVSADGRILADDGILYFSK
jgi:hypothetical protein